MNSTEILKELTDFSNSKISNLTETSNIRE